MMVSYYNSLAYSQKHNPPTMPYPGGQPWAWQSNYHPGPNQLLGDVDNPHSMGHHMQYYNHMFGNHPSADWHNADNFPSGSGQAHLLQHPHQNQHPHQQQHPQAMSPHHQHLQQPSSSSSQHQHHQHQQQHASGSGSGSASASGSGGSHLNESPSSSSGRVSIPQISNGLISPPITVSEVSSPPPSPPMANPMHNAIGSPPHSSSSSNMPMQPSPVKSPYYDWMKKQSYAAQPTPGKTRTKDKYRVVYNDFQRLELEKEYCTARYITIRRKTELAQALQLSERQVKIWFQNRRAKERKLSKKRDDTLAVVQQQSTSTNNLANFIDGNQRIDHNMHIPIHGMNPIAMNMPMGMHHHPPAILHRGHHPLAVPPNPPHLHPGHPQMAAAAAAVNAL